MLSAKARHVAYLVLAVLAYWSLLLFENSWPTPVFVSVLCTLLIILVYLLDRLQEFSWRAKIYSSPSAVPIVAGAETPALPALIQVPPLRRDS